MHTNVHTYVHMLHTYVHTIHAYIATYILLSSDISNLDIFIVQRSNKNSMSALLERSIEVT